jgi:hypothetical protein
VKKDLLTAENFRDFVFTNPVELHTRNNPNFFKGTTVENDVQLLLAQRKTTGSAPT